MSRDTPSIEEIRAMHQAESDYISDCIRRGDMDHLRASEGAFAKGFATLTPEDRRNRAKARLRALYEKSSLEP